MFNATGQSQSPTCPKCRRAASLRLHARLPEADGFPEVQCFECRACSEVVIIERVNSVAQPHAAFIGTGKTAVPPSVTQPVYPVS